MNLRRINSASRRGVRHQSAFTMAEIAIALGVIAFALVAIIGILPVGLQVQRDNREETLVTQDARVLIEAIKSGGRDQVSDLGSFVVAIDDDGIDYSLRTPPGIPTTNLIKLLTDTDSHNIILSSISGAAANRGTDLGFRYQVRGSITNDHNDFINTPLSNQVHDVRLRFAWPVLPNNRLASEVNNASESSKYVARALVSGWRTNGVFYAQQFYQELFLTNSP